MHFIQQILQTNETGVWIQALAKHFVHAQNFGGHEKLGQHARDTEGYTSDILLTQLDLLLEPVERADAGECPLDMDADARDAARVFGIVLCEGACQSRSRARQVCGQSAACPGRPAVTSRDYPTAFSSTPLARHAQAGLHLPS